MIVAAMDPAVAIVLGAIVAALGSYVAAARRLSGKIDTSEAQSLWDESASIREDYRERIAVAEKRQADLEARVALLETDNADLRRENLKLRERNIECEREMAKMTERCEHVCSENKRLRKTIQRLGGFEDESGES